MRVGVTVTLTHQLGPIVGKHVERIGVHLVQLDRLVCSLILVADEVGVVHGLVALSRLETRT